MGIQPKTILEDAMAVEALERLENNNITQILVTDKQIIILVLYIYTI